MTFTPISDLGRHQKYFGAFSISKDKENLNITSYLAYITKFINDPNISHLDQEDLQFFKDLLFEGPYGKVHIEYYMQIINKWAKIALPQAARILSRYADFLGQVSEMFLHDFYNAVLRGYSFDIAVALFPLLSHTNKVEFIKMVDTYPNIVKAIPKLKLYMVFS